MNADRDVRDPALDALMREHSTQMPMPPAHVDTAILAAARRAVASTPREAGSAKAMPSWRGWMPLAAAAVIGVVVIGILPLAPTLHDETASTVNDSPKAARGDAATSRGELAPSPPTAAMQPSAPPPFAPPPAADALERPLPRPENAAPGMKRLPEREARRPAASVPGPSAETGSADARPSAAPAIAPRMERDDDATRGATEWIARIRTLRAEGKLAEAARELARFRAAVVDADARLPADMQGWAKSVAR